MPQRKITIGGNYSDYVFKDAVESINDKQSMNTTGLTGKSDSRLRRTSERSLDRLKGANAKKHEFSVVIGGETDEDKRSFNAAIAKYDKLNLEREYTVALSKNDATSTALVPIKEEQLRGKYHITKRQHENAVLELRNKVEVVEKRENERRTLEEKKRKEEIDFLKYQGHNLDQFLKSITGGK